MDLGTAWLRKDIGQRKRGAESSVFYGRKGFAPLIKLAHEDGTDAPHVRMCTHKNDSSTS